MIGKRLVLLLLVFVCTGCVEVRPTPKIIATPTPLAFTPLREALQRPAATSRAPVTTVGYLYVDRSGARLLDAVSLSAGTTPQPLTRVDDQVLVDTAAVEPVRASLRAAGDIRYAVVSARGQIDGPGSFGPQGRYRFQLNNAQIQTIAPIETTLALLLQERGGQGSFVRLSGALLADEQNARFVERIGPGGLPSEGARQIDLPAALRDTALLQKLQSSPNGRVRFGLVQIEGFWRNGTLQPLTIAPVS